MTTIKVRRGSAALWASINPILSAGEPGYEDDEDRLKIGDGVKRWNSLPYVVGGPINGSLLIDGTVVASKLATDVSEDYAEAEHVHTLSDIADITGVYAAASHNHDASEVASGTVATARLGSGTANATTFLRGDQTWAAPAGGSDPWTNVILGSDFTISTTSNNTVTGLAFTPAASTTYLVELFLLVRTATTTTGARPGIAWPTGLTDAASQIKAPNSNTALAFRNQGALTTQNAASTGLPTTTDSYLAMGTALLVVGGSPSGNFQVTLASETGAVNVTMKAGSFIRYRTIT